MAFFLTWEQQIEVWRILGDPAGSVSLSFGENIVTKDSDRRIIARPEHPGNEPSPKEDQ